MRRPPLIVRDEDVRVVRPSQERTMQISGTFPQAYNGTGGKCKPKPKGGKKK